MNKKVMLRVKVDEGKVKDALLPLMQPQRVLVMEKALLYYARHLEENPQIIDPLFDAEKVNSTQVFEPLKKEVRVLTEEEELEKKKKAMEIMIKYLEMDCEKKCQVDSRRESLKKKNIGERCIFTLESSNEKIKRMLSYARSVSLSINGLVIRALEYYIDLVENDESIQDFYLVK